MTQANRLVRDAYMTTLLGILAALLSIAPAHACEVQAFRVPFQPGMGTHVAYYCRASLAEKRQALEAVKRQPCVAQRLKDHASKKGMVLSESATDVRPYYFTKQDAVRSGPILDVRLLLNEELEGERVAKLSGVRVLATGKKLEVTLPPLPGGAPVPATMFAIDYELGEPSVFTSECPFSTCYDSFDELCPKPKP